MPTQSPALRLMPDSDLDLIRRAQRGDADAFGLLVRQWYPRSLRFARSMLRVEQDAEEAVQDAWLRVWKALPRYEEREQFDKWFFRILANRCRTRGVRVARDGRAMAFDHPGLEAAPTAPAAEAEGWREEIHHALAELPAAQKEAFLLYHIEGYSYDEIAGVTGAGVSALKMRVKRACDHLRHRLQEVLRD
ncbi:MAG: RNA polymerase sigma factor [Gemmatimonadaceae bacterium]